MDLKIKYLLSILFRFLTLFVKSILIFFLSKELSVEELGSYGLIVSTSAILVILIGFEYYCASSRAMLTSSYSERKFHVYNQFVFYILMYILYLPIIFLLGRLGVLRLDLIYAIYVLMIFEHFNQEAYRNFIAIDKQFEANIILFFRAGMWPIIVIILVILRIQVNLKIIVKTWLVSDFIAIIVSMYIYNINGLLLKTFKKPDFQLILNNFKTAIVFFISAFAYKIIEYSNRYFIKYFLTDFDLGVFTFYTSYMNFISVGVYTVVIIYFYPKLITSYNNNCEFVKLKKRFSLSVVVITVLFSILIIVFLDLILQIIQKNEYINNVYIGLYILVSIAVYNISLIPHYLLFAIKDDLWIMYSTIAGAIINIVANFIFIKVFGLIGVCYSAIISNLIIGVMKYCRFYIIRNKNI